MSAAVFGSAARGEDGLASDFDLLVVTHTEDVVWPWQAKLAAAAGTFYRMEDAALLLSQVADFATRADAMYQRRPV